MKFVVSETKTKEMLEFGEREWAIADTEHFGKPGRWKEEHIYISAIDKDEIVGMLHYLLKAGVMEIVTLIVSYNHRKQGVGIGLMREAERIAKERGLHKLYLITGEGWDSNEFYRKSGFIQTGELRTHFMKENFIEFSKFI